MIGLNATTLTIAQPQVQTNIQRKSATNFELTVSNVPNTISGIMVPVWSIKTVKMILNGIMPERLMMAVIRF